MFHIPKIEENELIDKMFIFIQILKNLKIFLWKKRRFRLRWDSSPDLSIAGMKKIYRFQNRIEVKNDVLMLSLTYLS